MTEEELSSLTKINTQERPCRYINLADQGCSEGGIMRTKVETSYYMEEGEGVHVLPHEDSTISIHRQVFFLNIPLGVAKQLLDELYSAINKIEIAAAKKGADEED